MSRKERRNVECQGRLSRQVIQQGRKEGKQGGRRDGRRGRKEEDDEEKEDPGRKMKEERMAKWIHLKYKGISV